MTIEQFYNTIGGDYVSILNRLVSEKLIEKLLNMFLNDKSYQNILKNLEENNIDEAFRNAHTLKGTSQNLSFTNLYQASSIITDALRNGANNTTEEMLNDLTANYNLIISTIQNLNSTL